MVIKLLYIFTITEEATQDASTQAASESVQSQDNLNETLSKLGLHLARLANRLDSQNEQGTVIENLYSPHQWKILPSKSK